MTRRAEHVLLVAALIAAAAAFAVFSVPLSAGSRLAPLIVSAATLVLLAGELRALLRNGDGSRAEPPPEARERTAGERAALGWMALLIALLFLFGMVPGLPVYLLLYLRRRAALGWRSALGFALGLWIVLSWGLQMLLRLPLYEGWLVSRVAVP